MTYLNAEQALTNSRKNELANILGQINAACHDGIYRITVQIPTKEIVAQLKQLDYMLDVTNNGTLEVKWYG